jgi:geranylgeranyl pyrophosphate synthase
MLEPLKCEIRRAIGRYCAEPIHDVALCALSRPGYALHPESACRAGMLALEAYSCIVGSPSSGALQAAAGVELQMEAAFMFDEVADRDADPAIGLSQAEELALAISLLSCGAAVACEASFGRWRDGSSLAPLQDFFRNSIAACGGQFLDAHLARLEQSTLDQALSVASQKAGSLGRFSAAFGASMATQDPAIIKLFGDFGFNLFTYLQLIDDLRDACPAAGPMLDLKQRKKTVPLVFLSNLKEKACAMPDGGIMQSQTDEEVSQNARREFKDSGAALFGAIVAEVFLNRAKANLEEIKSRLGKVSSLEHLVSSLEITPQEVFALPEGLSAIGHSGP